MLPNRETTVHVYRIGDIQDRGYTKAVERQNMYTIGCVKTGQIKISTSLLGSKVQSFIKMKCTHVSINSYITRYSSHTTYHTSYAGRYLFCTEVKTCININIKSVRLPQWNISLGISSIKFSPSYLDTRLQERQIYCRLGPFN